MPKLVSMIFALDPARRIMVLLATVGAFAAVLGIARTVNSPNMSLLYSGLEPAAAGEVIQSLDQMGAVYEVRDNAIFVDVSRRDSLRMALAAEGKPASSTGGYEILDGLSGFGTTSQMFDAAYWRAKEGELARTILASPHIRSARVHISNAPARSFGTAAPAAASVVVTTGGGGLSAGHAKALKFLVASAVAGLAPEHVSIIDSESGLVASGDEIETPALAAGDRAAALKANVERLLEARVGYGNAVVEVNIDTVTEREQITERRYDPDSRVAISTVTEETSTSAQDARGGAVTVAGNLPDGDSSGSGGNSSSQESETREQVNYEVSETHREVLRAPGAIRRLSVAVLVDGLREVAADGTVSWEPRPDQELDALRDLVASAVGFDEGRGDVITLQSMEFQPIVNGGTEAVAPSLVDRLLVDPMRLIQLGALATVALVLGLFVVRPILLAAPSRGALPPALDPPRAPAGDGDASLPALPRAEALDGDVDDTLFTPQMALPGNGDAMSSLETLRSGEDQENADLAQMIDGRGEETAAVLREWLEDRAEPA